MTTEKTKRNIWKWLFFTLLVINILAISWIVTLYYGEPETPIFQLANEAKEAEELEFKIETDKKNLNHFINRYLEELTKGDPISYSVLLDKKVRLAGSIHAFGQEIPATVVLEPIVQENGDLLLQLESISLGRLQLPNRHVLEYIASNYHMPDWIQVNPEREDIYVAITDITKDRKVGVRAEAFDLENNHISFSIHTRYEVLPFNNESVLRYLK